MAQFYIAPKVHKQPWKTRPIVSDVGSPLSYLSKVVDAFLQDLLHLIFGYLKDSQSLITQLKKLGKLPPTAVIIIADAVAMYTNIDTNHAIFAFQSWFDHHKSALPTGFPVKFVLLALNLIMRNNVIQFDDTYWLQLTGTAMGTSTACMFATIYYAFKEATDYLKAFLQTDPATPKPMLFYSRLIDDTIQIWDLAKLPNGITAHNLVKTIESRMKFGILEWDVEPPTRQANFLDLTVTLKDNGSISTKTHIKAMDLHLQVHPTSFSSLQRCPQKSHLRQRPKILPTKHTHVHFCEDF